MALLTYIVAMMVVLGSVSSEGPTRKTHETHQNSSIAAQIKRQILEGYDGEEPPLQDEPTHVRIGVYINTVNAINEINMDYTIGFYLRQSWQDPRLAFDEVDGVKSVNMGRLADRLWVPDTFFPNEKEASFHGVPTRTTMARVNATGHVWYVTKVTATLSSPMKLQRYPKDHQLLPLKFESFSHSMATLIYSWLDDPVAYVHDVLLPRFTLYNYTLHDCSLTYSTGSYPCLQIQFALRRDIGYYIIQIVIPSVLMVILSWGGFWISITAVTARVTLGLLTVLVMTTLHTRVQDSSPKISYIKASDIWMGVCMIFILSSVLEAAIVSYMCQRETGGKSSGVKHPKADRVDLICKIAFPLAFLLFNIIFWAVYA